MLGYGVGCSDVLVRLVCVRARVCEEKNKSV